MEQPVSDMPDLPAEIERGAKMLRQNWLDAHRLRADEATFERITEPLRGYSNAGVAVADWFRTYYLDGCRKLVDHDGRTSSIRRGLELIRDNATLVTEDLVFERSLAPNLRGEDRYSQRVRREVHDRLRARVEESGGEYGGHLTGEAVQNDLDELNTTSQALRDYVNDRIAHRNMAPTSMLETADVDRLLDLVMDLVFRWRQLLDGVTTMNNFRALRGTKPMRMALELFDWPEYAEALSEAEMRVGPHAAKEAYEQLRENVRIRFEFDEP